jgi:hypothetical protein
MSQQQSLLWVRETSLEVEPVISNGMSLKFSGGHLRMVSYTYNFADVLNLKILAELALQVMAARKAGSAR